MEVALLFSLLVVLLIVGVPIAFGLFLVGLVGVYLVYGDLGQLQSIAWFSWNKSTAFLYLSVPLFIYMAQVLSLGGVGHHLFRVASVWLRRLPGGLLVSTVGAATLFSALSGTSIATAATIGMVSGPELIRRGYPRRIVAGVLSAGGGLGMLIPPSIPLILYGAITEESIGKLFIAGVVPGLLLATLYSAMVIGRAKFGDVKVAEPSATWSERLHVTKDAGVALLLILVVFMSYYTGFFTPTEAGAAGVVLSLLVVMTVYRTFKVKDLQPSLQAALKTSGMIYVILIGALYFGYAMTLLRVPAQIAESIGNLPVSPLTIIFALNLFYLVLGCFLDVGSLMLITLPLVYPLVTNLGFDGVWFGIVLMINFNMAVETPPVGLNLFVLQGVLKMPFEDIVRGVLPFYLCEVAGLILVIFFPQIALWLPGTFR